MVRVLALWLGLFMTSSTHAAPSIDAQLSNPGPWLREEVLLTVEVIDDRSIIEQILPPWTPAGVMIRPLAGQQERLKTAEGVRILHRHRWAVMPLYAGPLDLQPPEIEARMAGGGRFTLTPPMLHLDARPIDPLIPVDIPIGPLRVEAAPLPDAIPRDRPLEWMVTIHGQGLSSRSLRRWLDESLRDTGSLRVYPPDVRLEDNIDPGQPLLQRATARIVLEPRESGRVALPALILPYVDTADGQVRLAHLAPSATRVMHPLWLLARPWLPWGAGGLLLALGLWRVWPHWQRRRQKRAWIETLRRAPTAATLRAAWRAADRGQEDAETLALLGQLDAACYGREGRDEARFEALKRQLIDRLG